MTRNILILDGHPDADEGRYIHALAKAYHAGAAQAGHDTLTLRLADIDCPVLRTQADYERGEPSEAVRQVQHAFDWADHVVVLFPLWLGSLPAALKALLEQTFRPGFAFSTETPGRSPVKFLRGKSARIIVTMGMPAFVYRWYLRSHSVRTLCSILRFVGFGRTRATLIGSIGTLEAAKREQWLQEVRDLGRRGR